MKPGFKFSPVGIVFVVALGVCVSSVHSSHYGSGRTINALVGALCAFSNIGDSSALPFNHLPPHLFQSRLGSPMPDIGGSSGPPPPAQAQSDEEDSDSEEDEELLESGPRVEPHITPLNRDQCLAKLLCGMSVPVTGGGSKKNYYSEYANIVSKFFEAFPLDDELQSKESIETYDDYSNEDDDKPKRTNSRRKPLNSSRVEATTPKLHLFDLALVDVAKPEELNGQPQNRTKKEFIQKVMSAYRYRGNRVSRARKLVENLGQKLQTVRQCQSIDGCPFTFKQLREQLKKKEAQRISSNVPLPPLGLQPQGPNPNRPQQQQEPIAFKPKPYVSAESRPRPIPPTPAPESAELFSKEEGLEPIFPPHKDVNKGDDEMEEIFGPPKVNKKPNMGFHHGIDENFNYEYNPERPWRPGSSGSNSYAHRPWNVNRPPSGGPNNQARPQRPQNTGPNGKRNPQQQSKPIAQRRPGGPQPLPPVVMNQQHKKQSPPAPASAPQKKKPSPFPKKKISYLNSPYAKPPVGGDDDDEGAEDINKVAPLELVGNADAGEAEPSNKRKTTTTTEAPDEVESSTAGKSRDGDESDEYDDDGDYYDNDDDVNDDEGADDDDNYSDEEEDEEEEEEDEDGDGEGNDGTTGVEKVSGGTSGTGTGVSESSSVKDKKQNSNSGGSKKNDKRKRKKEKNKKNKNKKRKNKNKNKNKNKQQEQEESDIETTKQVAKEQFYDDENEKVSEIWTKLNFATTGANYKKPLERLKGTSSVEEEGASEEIGPSEEEEDDDDDEDDIDEEEEGLKGSLATLQKIRAGGGGSGGASVSSGSTEDDADDEVDDENQSKRKKTKTNNKVVKVEGEKVVGEKKEEKEVPEKDIVAQSNSQKGKGKKTKKNKKNKKQKKGSSEEENDEGGAEQKRKQHIMMEIGGRPLVPKPDPHSQTNNAHKTTSLMSNRFKFQFINPYMGGIPPPSASSAGEDEPRPQPMEGGYSAPLRTSYGGNKPESGGGGAASALSAAASALPFKFKLNAGPLGHFGGTSGASMIPLGGFGHGNSGGMSMEMMPDPHHPPPPTAFGPNGPPNGLRNDAMMGPPQQQHGQQQQQHFSQGGGGGFGGGAASSLFKYNPIPALTNLFKKQTHNGGGGDGHSAPPVNAFIHRPIGPESSGYKRDNRPSPASGSSNAGKKGSKGKKKGNKGKKEKV